MDDSYERMIKQTTEEAQLYINASMAARERLQAALGSDTASISTLGQRAYTEALKIAEEHDGNFGTMFLAELDAVNWVKVVREDLL